MSDIKLFRVQPSGVEPMHGGTFDAEKELQALVENHMEALLAVRFLATEYSTGKTHRGRIDTLGLDENDAPVIVEYKRHSSENVINQGLFYLDWLLDHRAEFEQLVQKTYGQQAADGIDWTAPRLLCIGGDFTRYDEHAVQQIDRNIDLLRYRTYAEGFLILELVNSVSTSSPTSGASDGAGPDKPKTWKTASESLEQAAPALRELYGELRDVLLAMGEDVQERTLNTYFAFRRIKNFACVCPVMQKTRLVVYLKVDPDEVDLEEGFTRDVREIGHLAPGDLEVTLNSVQDVERAATLFRQSYEAS